MEATKMSLWYVASFPLDQNQAWLNAAHFGQDMARVDTSFAHLSRAFREPCARNRKKMSRYYLLSGLSRIFRKPCANVYMSRKVPFAQTFQIYACGPRSYKTFHGFLHDSHIQKGTLGALGFCIFSHVFPFFHFHLSIFPKSHGKPKRNQKNNPVRRIWSKSIPDCCFCFFWIFSRFFGLPNPNCPKSRGKPKKTKKTILWEESGVSLFQIVFFVFFGFSRGFCSPKPFFFIPSCSPSAFQPADKNLEMTRVSLLALLAFAAFGSGTPCGILWHYVQMVIPKQNAFFYPETVRLRIHRIQEEIFPPDPWIKHFCRRVHSSDVLLLLSLGSFFGTCDWVDEIHQWGSSALCEMHVSGPCVLECASGNGMRHHESKGLGSPWEGP